MKDTDRLQVMLDIETLGTKPGAVVWAIGAGAIENRQVTKTFYALISIRDAVLVAKMDLDLDTLGWWMTQGPEARAELVKALAGHEAYSQHGALALFAEWLRALVEPFKQIIEGDAAPLLDPRRTEEALRPLIWGNGANFDPGLIEAAMRASGVPVPWHGHDVRCYRTLKRTFPDVSLIREGTHHRADADAVSQAQHMIALQAHAARLATLDATARISTQTTTLP